MPGWRLMDETKKSTLDLLHAVAERQTLTRNLTVLELLQDAPLQAKRVVQKLFSQPQFGHVAFPGQMDVHCDHHKCGGVRRHVKQTNSQFELNEKFYCFVAYQCTNCTESFKIFGLKAEREGEAIVPGICTKIYQEPPFGQPIPKRLFQVIGEANRDHFLQARRAIARELGIGAYAYYRRIVENTKFELVGSVLQVAQATNASP